MSVLDRNRDTPTTLTFPRERAAPRPHRHGRGLSLGCLLFVALESLAQNKIRTILATLGIIIGVGCVITMMGWRRARASDGSPVRSWARTCSPSGPRRQRTAPSSRGAARAQLRLADWLRSTKSAHWSCGPLPAWSQRRRSSTATKHADQVLGVTSDYFPIRNYQLAEGRTFTRARQLPRARLRLGPIARSSSGPPPVGEHMREAGQRFRCRLLKPDNPNWDDRVWVPVPPRCRFRPGLHRGHRGRGRR